MKFFIILIFIISFKTQSSELTLAVEPTFISGQAESVFKPLNDLLESKTGHTLKIVNAKNYYFYSRDASKEMPDLAFDPPHIAALRMNQNNYQPLVQTVEDLTFHLVVDQNNYNDFSTVDSLRTQSIATMQHPNLASILFEKWFSSSIIIPNKLLAQHTWVDGIDLIFDGSALATIIPSTMLEMYPNLVSIKQSKPFPGMTFSAAPHLSVEIKNEIKSFLIGLREQEQSYEVLYELNTKYFIQSNKDQIAGYDKLIPSNYRNDPINLITSNIGY